MFGIVISAVIDSASSWIWCIETAAAWNKNLPQQFNMEPVDFHDTFDYQGVFFHMRMKNP